MDDVNRYVDKFTRFNVVCDTDMLNSQYLFTSIEFSTEKYFITIIIIVSQY